MAEITSLLARANNGEPQAREELYSRIYQELTVLARQTIAREATVSHLDAQGLVSEAYLRLESRGDLTFENRRAFFAYAARVMRSVIVDALRERLAAKRGGNMEVVSLDTSIEDHNDHAHELLAVHTALQALARLSERCHDVFEMHFFAGMSVEDICDTLKLSPATVHREIRKARAWLKSEMQDAPSAQEGDPGPD